MANSMKQKASFVLDIKFMQHGSWQGTIKCIENKESYNFRSALEMIRIIDDIAKQGYEVQMPSMDEFAI